MRQHIVFQAELDALRKRRVLGKLHVGHAHQPFQKLAEDQLLVWIVNLLRWLVCSFVFVINEKENAVDPGESEEVVRQLAVLGKLPKLQHGHGEGVLERGRQLSVEGLDTSHACVRYATINPRVEAIDLLQFAHALQDSVLHPQQLLCWVFVVMQQVIDLKHHVLNSSERSCASSCRRRLVVHHPVLLKRPGVLCPICKVEHAVALFLVVLPCPLVSRPVGVIKSALSLPHSFDPVPVITVVVVPRGRLCLLHSPHMFADTVLLAVQPLSNVSLVTVRPHHRSMPVPQPVAPLPFIPIS
mmetsp:Transcript_28975/g.67102  ORF Transcript_28975/g.67102 Transcript_28975/m.67102 type:complete len:299 (-) Transcript_28975:673-1569(-)